MDGIFCRLECGSFPRSEFNVDPKHGLLHRGDHTILGSRVHTDAPRLFQWERTGWFAAIDSDEPSEYQWQPNLQLDGGLCFSFEIWFRTEEECNKFIRESILTAGSHMYEPSDE